MTITHKINITGARKRNRKRKKSVHTIGNWFSAMATCLAGFFLGSLPMMMTRIELCAVLVHWQSQQSSYGFWFREIFVGRFVEPLPLFSVTASFCDFRFGFFA